MADAAPDDAQVGEHVAVEGEESVVEQVLGELDAAGGAAGFGLGQVAEPGSTGLTLAQYRLELVGEEAAGEDDVIDAVECKPFDHEGQKGPVHEGEDRLRCLGRERAKTGALAANQYQCLQFCLLRFGANPRATDSLVGESGFPQIFSIKIVTSIDYEWLNHPCSCLGPVNIQELRPLGY